MGIGYDNPADLIEQLQAENARLREDNAKLLDVMEFIAEFTPVPPEKEYLWSRERLAEDKTLMINLAAEVVAEVKVGSKSV